VWSNQAVKTIINEHFIFWQVYKESAEGMRYLQFYPFQRYPYVAILDPRTGELLHAWATIIDSVTFCDFITEFLMDHPSPDGSIGLEPGASPAVSAVIANQNDASAAAVPMLNAAESIAARSIYEQSEEEQIKLAIEASLQDVTTSARPRASPDSSDIESIGPTDSEPEEPDPDSPPTKSPKKTAVVSSPYIVEEQQPVVATVEDWKKYIGTSDKWDLMIRYPDSVREHISLTSDTKLKALFLYLESKGYSLKEYDVVTNFPRKNVHDLSVDTTLLDAGLQQRENVFVQHKT